MSAKYEKKSYAKYCERCGDLVFQKDARICRICGSSLKECSSDYDLSFESYVQHTDIFRKNEERFLKEVVKPNPNFDSSLSAQREAILHSCVGISSDLPDAPL